MWNFPFALSAHVLIKHRRYNGSEAYEMKSTIDIWKPNYQIIILLAMDGFSAKSRYLSFITKYSPFTSENSYTPCNPRNVFAICLATLIEAMRSALLGLIQSEFGILRIAKPFHASTSPKNIEWTLNINWNPIDFSSFTNFQITFKHCNSYVTTTISE